VGEAHQPKTGAVLEGIAFGCTVRKSGGPSRPCGGAARYEPIRRRHDDPVAVSCTGLVGVSGLGQTGTIADLYRHYGIDTNAIIAAAQAMTPGAPIRHLKAI
jgi:hypothetical protein